MSALGPRESDYSYTAVNTLLPHGINDGKKAGNRADESHDLELI